MEVKIAQYVTFDELCTGFNAFKEFFYNDVIENLGIVDNRGEGSNITLVNSELIYQLLLDQEDNQLIGDLEKGRKTVMERILGIPENCRIDFN